MMKRKLRLSRKERRRLARTERRKQKASKGPKVKHDQGPVFFQHPLSDVPHDALREALVEHAHQSEKRFETLREEIIVLLKEGDPLSLLSNIAHAALMVGMSDDGRIFKSKTEHEILLQYHVELAQAIILSIPKNELDQYPMTSQKIQNIWDKLIEISNAFRDRRYVQIETAHSDVDRHLIALQERVRLHTQGVRNWGYYTQVLEILRRLYKPLDDHCERLIGLKATELIDVFDKMLRKTEERGGEYRHKLSAAFNQATKKEMIQEYHNQFGLPDESSKELLEHTRKQKWSRKDIMAAFMNHSAFFVTGIFLFELDQITGWLDRDKSEVRRALDGFSFSYGSLSHHDFEHLFLANPIWEKPLIKESESLYFCCLPAVFFGFSFQIFNRIFAMNGDSKIIHEKHRSKFLENEITRTLNDAFSADDIKPNVKWNYDGIPYESDLLIRIDSHLFIVEAKSGTVSWPALRGASKRMKYHIDELLISPAKQSKRLEEAILKKKSGVEKDNLEIDFDVSRIQRIVRLSITLEDFSTIQSNLREIVDSGIFGHDLPIAVAMSLADLQSVFHILESPIEKMHYLLRREEIQNSVKYLADELDLLGLYLRTGFSLGEFEQGQAQLISVGMSSDIDEYFQALDQGIEREKPRRKLTKWFSDIEYRLSGRKPPRWTEAALMVLDTGFDDQKKLEAQFGRICRSLRKRRPSKGEIINTIGVFPPAWRRTGLACVAFYEDERSKRHAIMESGSMHVFRNSHAERCLVIACDVNGDNYPYATLGVFDRPSELPLPSVEL